MHVQRLTNPMGLGAREERSAVFAEVASWLSSPDLYPSGTVRLVAQDFGVGVEGLAEYAEGLEDPGGYTRRTFHREMLNQVRHASLGQVRHYARVLEENPSVPQLTAEQSKRRVAELKARGCKVRRVKVPGGDVVVLKKCPSEVAALTHNPTASADALRRAAQRALDQLKPEQQIFVPGVGKYGVRITRPWVGSVYDVTSRTLTYHSLKRSEAIDRATAILLEEAGHSRSANPGGERMVTTGGTTVTLYDVGGSYRWVDELRVPHGPPMSHAQALAYAKTWHWRPYSRGDAARALTRSSNPRRPPKDWFARCVAGVSERGGAADPQSVCGALWYRKLSAAQRRYRTQKERA